MFKQAKLTTTQLFTTPAGRVILILGTMLLAALVGGAPSDASGV